MRLSIDIAGQITQLNLDSVLGCKRSDGFEKAVHFPSRTKKEIIKKYKGQVVRLVEKLHSILVYYCIKDCLDNVKEIKVCKDVNYRKLRELFPLLFKDRNYLCDIKIKARKKEEPKSNGHAPAIRAFRKRKRADEIITKEKIEKMLFEFKRK